MCGICGWIYKNREEQVHEKLLHAACGRMLSRGPDSGGQWSAPGIGLAMRRLAIIDIQGGEQPMRTEDGRFTLVYNGECYNHAHLRRILQSNGHRFRTRCDTEVILRGFAEWGESLPARINGMFAFAVWDAAERTLFVARDPLGIKPLYYFQKGGDLAFASEIKPLFCDPEIPREPDLQAVSDYLTFKYVPAPRTGFKDIQKLPAAHWGRWKDGALSLQRYWDAATHAEEAWDESEALEHTRQALDASVKSRLMSDVPLGVMLSGGVDSSLISSLAASAHKGIDTFTIGFRDADYDESRYARNVADHIGSRHHERAVHPAALESLCELPEILEEPLADSSALPLLQLCKLARESVTVALAGDGGDELGAGYPRYAWDQRVSTLLRLPGLLPGAAVAGHLLQALPASRELGRRIEKFSATAALPRPERYARWMSCFTIEEKRAILGPEAQRRCSIGDEADRLRPYFERSNHLGVLSSLQYVDLNSFLADDLLLKADKISMHVSLELRTPFLDPQVVEALLRTPSALRIRRGELKHTIKALCARSVPPSAVYRRKQGFSVPLQHWFANGIPAGEKERILHGELVKNGILRIESVRPLLQAARLGRTDIGHKLYSLLFLESWWRTFFNSNRRVLPFSAGSAAGMNTS